MKRFLILALLIILALPVFSQDADADNAELMRGYHASMGRTRPTEKQIADEHAAVAGVWEVFCIDGPLGLRIFTGTERKLYLAVDAPSDININKAKDRYDIYWPSQTEADRMTIVVTDLIGSNWRTYSYIFEDKDTMITTRIDKHSEWFGDVLTYKRKK